MDERLELSHRTKNAVEREFAIRMGLPEETTRKLSAGRAPAKTVEGATYGTYYVLHCTSPKK
jgi:hypothetical protein